MENEYKEQSKFCNDLIKIHTLGDGNCLIHAILKGCYKDYRENPDIEYRKNLSIEVRKELSELITTPNDLYRTEVDVCNLIRTQYNTENPRSFIEFLRCMYKYESDYIEYPESPIPYKHNGKYYCIFVYREYVENYKEYILKFYQKITNKNKEKISPPKPKNKAWFHEPEQYLSNLDEMNYKLISKAYNELEELVNYEINKLKYDLEIKLDTKLYLPNHFNENVIESVLKNETPPLGKYSNYEYNCHLFTSCNAAHLMKLEWEYCQIPGLVCLGNISEHFDSNKFISDMDGLSFIPELMSINLIIMNFNENYIINIYEHSSNDNFILIHNQDNIHFETVGINVNNKIITLFDRNHFFVQECFNSLKRENKQLNFDCFNQKVDKNVIEILRENFGDKIEIEPCFNDKDYAYIKYRQTDKTTYRFYIDKNGNITSGNAPERIKMMIKDVILKY